MTAEQQRAKRRRIALVRGMVLSSTALCFPEMARDDAEAIAAWNRRHLIEGDDNDANRH